jgi:hypothetical protein
MTDTPRLPLARTPPRPLSFRGSREELLALDRRHLILGLVCTWLVGMGLMSGMRAEGTANDAAYQVLFVLTLLSWMAVAPLFLAYLTLAALAPRERWRARARR